MGNENHEQMCSVLNAQYCGSICSKLAQMLTIRTQWAQEGVGSKFLTFGFVVDKWIRSLFKFNEKFNAREVETLLLATTAWVRIDRAVQPQAEREMGCRVLGIGCIDNS